ncbi:hypothetical protein [Sphingomonas sp. 22176]|uniref:hypothetical protein n=1 Tax=Sphingomonas sp. 22176 TaxID=3453884 RepID=UPI003F86B670
MIDLLERAIDAHGGWKRWQAIRSITARLTTGGALWDIKRPGFLTDREIIADRTTQHLSFAVDGGERLLFTPSRVWAEDRHGAVLESRDDPAAAFAGQTLETPWDPLHATFFSGEALWTYLTQPFLYAYPGMIVEEIAPWVEAGETWRSLQVTFPDTIVSHTRTQITRFGPDGLIRRHDYTVDILGGARGVNYAHDYRSFDGILVPTQRRVFAADDAWQAVRDPLLVSIDIADMRFE